MTSSTASDPSSSRRSRTRRGVQAVAAAGVTLSYGAYMVAAADVAHALDGSRQGQATRGCAVNAVAGGFTDVSTTGGNVSSAGFKNINLLGVVGDWRHRVGGTPTQGNTATLPPSVQLWSNQIIFSNNQGQGVAAYASFAPFSDSSLISIELWSDVCK